MKATPLFMSVVKNNKKLVELLLKNKADPNILSEDGKSPLYRAIELQNPEIVSLLLKYGAKVDIPFNGEYPIHLATRKNNAKILKLLLKYQLIDISKEQMQGMV